MTANKKKPAVQPGLNAKQFYEWCVANRACAGGLRYLLRYKFSLKQFWEKCSVPEYRCWILGLGDINKSAAYAQEAGCCLTPTFSKEFRKNRPAANAYLKRHYKCPVLKPVKARSK